MAALSAALLAPAAPAVAEPADWADRLVVKTIMVGVLRDDRDLRRYVCDVFWQDPPAAYRILWKSRISGIRQVVVRRGTRDAVDWVCS